MSDDFKREDSHKKGSVPDSWRRPKGKHSRARLQKKGARPVPKAGYRTDKEFRGKHPSGYEDVLVHNSSDLEELDPEKEAARIGSTVGGRKRKQMLEKADEEDIRVLNPATDSYEETETSGQDEVEEEAEDQEDEAETEETTENGSDYSEIVSGNIGDVKEELQEIEGPDYEAALEAEKDDKDRKTLKQWIENQQEE